MLKKTYTNYPSIDKIFHIIHNEPDVAFLDSSLTGNLGQYSIIGLSPYLKLVKSDVFTVNGKICDIPFEDFLKNYLNEHKEYNPTDLPLISGAIGYFSYDYGKKLCGLESTFDSSDENPKNIKIPDVVLIFYDKYIIENHSNHELHLIANGYNEIPEKGIYNLEKILNTTVMFYYKQAKSSQTSIFSDISAPLYSDVYSSLSSDFKKEEYINAIHKMVEHIVEGDIYVANMTQQLQVKSSKHPYDFFCQLRKNNPSPFGAYLNYEDFKIISSSPERFLKMKNGIIQTRPIKGTRKRGSTPSEDIILKRELENSVKDKSELLMITDLERNDLNRICKSGSVNVTELFTVESYNTVHHLISNIIGEIQTGLNAMDLINATFPGGSITGAPKMRAMEIINKLEHSNRNIYTGSLGYLSLDGSCDLNIIIRSALYKDGTYYIGCGGGITYESDANFEYEESLQKAYALLETLGIRCR